MKLAAHMATTIGLALLFFSLPTLLSAEEKRGANLVITLKDGLQVTGELIAAKSDSLILLDHATGKDGSAALAEISVIRIVRKSKALPAFLMGFVSGAAGGAAWGAHASHGDMPELGAIGGGFLVGSVAGLVGLAAGFGMGLDTEIAFAGLSETEKSRVLAKLSRQAREPSAYVPKPAGPTSGGAEGKPTPLSRGWTRFRLSWMPGYLAGSKGSSTETGVVSFRFTEALPPGEAGPYPSSHYWASHTRQMFPPGRLVLGYQWSPRLGTEIELNLAQYKIDHLVALQFTSTLDGITYEGVYSSLETVRSTSLLIGLSYRLLPPTVLQSHVVEVGVAAGPAWTGISLPPYLSFDEPPLTVDRPMTWTARARVSYDYQFNRSLSMGVYAEYRRLQADIPVFAANENLPFSNDDFTRGMWRMTEITFPAQSIRMGGFVCGLRFGIGF
jgi:hypothetical protein